MFLVPLQMQIDKELIDIENFEQAYHSRLTDLKILKEALRKNICMHLGGIIIECLLKDLIIKNENITKRRPKQKQWFAQNVYEQFSSSKKDITNAEFKGSCIENPEHRLLEALDLLEKLRDNMPIDISERLKRLYNPLNISNHNYIDLRYNSEESISEEIFKLWDEDFKIVIKWILEHKYLLDKEGA